MKILSLPKSTEFIFALDFNLIWKLKSNLINNYYEWKFWGEMDFAALGPTTLGFAYRDSRDGERRSRRIELGLTWRSERVEIYF